jgi:pimeloyl-ACP methyl ester carboxylesterase
MFRVVTDDGVALAGDSAGSGELPPVVFVHAFPTNRSIWQAQRHALEGRARTIAYDVRGFGGSDAPDDAAAYGQDRSVADLLCLLDDLGIERALLCGLSMGGNIVLNFALAHPGRVTALIISGTGSGTGNQAAFMDLVEGWAATAEREGMDAFAAAVMAHPIFGSYAERGEAERRHLHALITGNRVAGVAHTCRRVLARRPTIDVLAPRLATLSCPTSIVVGARDDAVMAAARIMAQTIPGARYLCVPDTGHFNNIEAPAALNGVLLAHLEAL